MKKFIMYGAGNIGRGFIGQTFSDAGYKVGFILELNRHVFLLRSFVEVFVHTCHYFLTELVDVRLSVPCYRE